VSGADEGYWADVPFGPGVSKLKVDANGLAALDKPEGVLSHPNAPADEVRSLVRAHYDPTEECFEWRPPGGTPRRLWLINRLDSATSGLILCSADGILAKAAKAQFLRRQIHKVYQALVFGKPRQASEAWKDVLEVRKKGGQIRAAAGVGRLPAASRMTLVRAGAADPRLSLIQLEPQTGRSHQLRVQCAKRGLPIVGDRTYGNFGANREFIKKGGLRRMFLHSLEVSLEYEFGGRSHTFSAAAPLPDGFDSFD
jgi:tRNA pseudouridine65 synthase